MCPIYSFINYFFKVHAVNIYKLHCDVQAVCNYELSCDTSCKHLWTILWDSFEHGWPTSWDVTVSAHELQLAVQATLQVFLKVEVVGIYEWLCML